MSLLYPFDAATPARLIALKAAVRPLPPVVEAVAAPPASNSGLRSRILFLFFARVLVSGMNELMPQHQRQFVVIQISKQPLVDDDHAIGRGARVPRAIFDDVETKVVLGLVWRDQAESDPLDAVDPRPSRQHSMRLRVAGNETGVEHGSLRPSDVQQNLGLEQRQPVGAGVNCPRLDHAVGSSGARHLDFVAEGDRREVLRLTRSIELRGGGGSDPLAVDDDLGALSPFGVAVQAFGLVLGDDRRGHRQTN